jgi:hypothetical protein
LFLVVYDKCSENESTNILENRKSVTLYLGGLKDIYSLWTLSCYLNKRIESTSSSDDINEGYISFTQYQW